MTNLKSHPDLLSVWLGNHLLEGALGNRFDRSIVTECTFQSIKESANVTHNFKLVRLLRPLKISKLCRPYQLKWWEVAKNLAWHSVTSECLHTYCPLRITHTSDATAAANAGLQTSQLCHLRCYLLTENRVAFTAPLSLLMARVWQADFGLNCMSADLCITRQELTVCKTDGLQNVSVSTTHTLICQDTDSVHTDTSANTSPWHW